MGNSSGKGENKTASAETFTQAQTPVKSNLPVSVTLRKQLNVKQSKHEYKVIYGCIKIDNALVLTELNKTRLIICNADGTDVHHFPLPKNPNYITKIDSITVAVSCYELSIQDTTILIVNISTGSVISRFSTCGDCRGISYNDDNMYVVIRSMIKVMDLTGKVIRSIPLPLDDIRDISVNGDRLVCIKYTSVYCCSLDGKLIWEFENYDLQDLRRVTTDAEGNVYATNGKTDTVVVVSGDGKHHRNLLTESDGLDTPIGISFDKRENILIVCNYSGGNVFLFDVKMIP